MKYFALIAFISLMLAGCGSDKHQVNPNSKKYLFSIDGEYDFTAAFCTEGAMSNSTQEAYNYFPLALTLNGTKATLETIYSSSCSSFSNDTVDETSSDTLVLIKGTVTCSANCNSLDPCKEKSASQIKEITTYTIINHALTLTDSANYGHCQDSAGRLVRSFTIK